MHLAAITTWLEVQVVQTFVLVSCVAMDSLAAMNGASDEHTGSNRLSDRRTSLLMSNDSYKVFGGRSTDSISTAADDLPDLDSLVSFEHLERSCSDATPQSGLGSSPNMQGLAGCRSKSAAAVTGGLGELRRVQRSWDFREFCSLCDVDGDSGAVIRLSTSASARTVGGGLCSLRRVPRSYDLSEFAALDS